MNNKKPVLAILVILLLLLIGYLLWLTLKGSTASSSYQTVAVAKGNVISNVTASGSVTAAGLSNITTKSNGNIDQILVANGQQVYPGTKIATVTLNKAGNEAKQAAYNTYLADRGTPKAAASWQAYLDVSGAVYAEAAGTIANIYVSPGMAIDGSNAPFTVATSRNSNTDYVQIAVSELDINKITIGQTASLNVPALPQTVLKGQVQSINTSGITKSGVVHYTVTILIQNPPHSLLNGMSVDANIILAQKTGVLVVPTMAISDSNGKTYVSVLKNGRPLSVLVTTGLVSNTSAEIVGGLSLGDRVIVGKIQPAASSSSSTVFNGLLNQSLPSPSANQNN